MAVTSPRRPGTTSRIPVPPTPEATWKILAGIPALLTVAALLLAIAAPLTPAPTITAVGAGLVLIVAVAYGRSAIRKTRRFELIHGLHIRLVPLLGPVVLKPRRWGGRGVGFPRRLRVVYGPVGAAALSDPEVLADAVGAVNEALGAKYTVHRRWPRRTQIEVRLLTAEELVTPKDTRPADQVRAEALLETMIPGRRIENVEVTDGVLRRIEGSHDLGAKLAAEGYQRRVENTFSRCMPGRWRCQWDTIHDTFAFELRPTFPDVVRMPPLERKDVDPVLSHPSAFITFGVDEDGNPVGWRPRRDPMGVVVGATGSGKTVLLRSLTEYVCWLGWLVLVVDGKGSEFLGLRDWPNVGIVANRVHEQVAVIHRAHAIMEERYSLVEQGRAKTADFEPVLVLIDEWADFRSNVMAWYGQVKPKGKAPTKPVVLDLLWSLIRKGRTARVHVLIGTQRPDAEYFQGDARDNLTFRVSLGRLKFEGARMMWESPAIGTTVPRGKVGRATAISELGQPVEIQSYFNPDPWDLDDTDPERLTLQHYKPAITRHERMVIIPPESLLDLDDDEGAEIALDYWDYANADWAWAREHPDLDPVQIAARAVSDRGREVSAAAAILGLGAAPETTTKNRPAQAIAPPVTDEPDQPRDTPPDQVQRPALRLVSSTEPIDEPATTNTVQDQEPPAPSSVESDGYLEPRWALPSEVQIGWLVRPDDDQDTWAVVDDIGPDVMDPSCVAISWRDDFDGDGISAIADDQMVFVREPEDDLDC